MRASSILRQVFRGPYQHSRKVLDYSWHQHPSEERQAIQDAIVTSFLEGGSRPQYASRPWLVYTAGTMGGGKTRTLKYLDRVGAFPLDDFLIVDPDKIKDCLPELQQLIAEDPKHAHSRLHKESGYIAEIIEREALQSGMNVVVDGSLRNSTWYAAAIGRIRAEFPSYRIAILLVTVSPQTAHARAERRAAITGRYIPKALLDDTIVQVPRSFATLRHLVDFNAVVDNDSDDRDPVLQPPATLESFAAVWRPPPKRPDPVFDVEEAGGSRKAAPAPSPARDATTDARDSDASPAGSEGSSSGSDGAAVAGAGGAARTLNGYGAPLSSEAPPHAGAAQASASTAEASGGAGSPEVGSGGRPGDSCLPGDLEIEELQRLRALAVPVASR